MLSDHWPLVDLRLRTQRLELRPPNDDELAVLAEVAADGVHQPGDRPFLTPWTDLPPRQRGLYVIQQHWSRRGAWSVAAWALELGVFYQERPVGMVALRARDFPVLREVTTESWLGLAHQRRGLGTEARAALLHLAFDGLGPSVPCRRCSRTTLPPRPSPAGSGTDTTASRATSSTGSR